MGFVCDSAKKELARCCLALSDVKLRLLHMAETILSTFFFNFGRKFTLVQEKYAFRAAAEHREWHEEKRTTREFK